MTDIAPPATDAAEGRSFGLAPLMFEVFVCSTAMMAFVALAGPIGRVLNLEPWHVGTAVTVAGVAWMLLARVWGSASDRYGRRAVILFGLAGFSICYALLCAFIAVALHFALMPLTAFAGLVLWRGLAGAFYAAVPPTSAALIADHTAPAQRAGRMAMLGAAGGAGMVFGPAFAGLLAAYGLGFPLYAIAPLPVIAWFVLWWKLPQESRGARPPRAALKLTDPRLRRALAVAFISMCSVAIAQITVGFYAIDRLGLDPQSGARAAGIALTCVGVALILSQTLVRKLGWPPARLIRIGGVVSALGFVAAAFATTTVLLAACYFVAAAGMGWVWPSVSALAANSVEAHEQGAAAGSVSSAQGLAVIVGPLAGTTIYGLHMAAPFLIVGAMLAAMALWPTASSRGRGLPA